MYPYINNSYNMKNNNSNYQNYVYSNDGERFFWAPFVVAGLAGTALGYGIANNNQINNMNKPYYSYYPAYPIVYYPNGFTNYNNFYY